MSWKLEGSPPSRFTKFCSISLPSTLLRQAPVGETVSLGAPRRDDAAPFRTLVASLNWIPTVFFST
jgi:hypothetical protein